MEISAEMVKKLREKTGVGMMDCKTALVECKGDFDRASEYLREKGLDKAAKKSAVHKNFVANKKSKAASALNALKAG